MRYALREGDVVARLGGDEFAVLQGPVPEREAAVRLGERLIAEVSVPYSIEGRSIGINVSVGIALAPECGDGEALLRAADEAGYEAKRAGKGLYSLASPKRPQEQGEADLHVVCSTLHFDPGCVKTRLMI